MTIWRAYIETFKWVVSLRPVLSTLVMAIILYGFFYPAAYKSQIATQLPIVVVDQNQTPLSRGIIRKLNTLQAVRVVQQTSNFVLAKQMVQAGQADAIFLIPDQLENSLLHSEQGGLGLYLSAAYLIKTKEIGAGMAGAIGATIEEQLAPLLQGTHKASTVNLTQYALYNPMNQYGSYIFPAVAGLIIQQTLLLGVGFLVGHLKQLNTQQKWRPSLNELLGMSLAFITIGYATCLYYFGFVFWLQDYPRDGNLIGLLLSTPIYITAVVMLAFFLASLFAKPEQAAQVLTFTSVPFFFLTGASWPMQAMPAWMSDIAWLVPSTAGVRQFIQLNQMGASIEQIWPNLAVLCTLSVLYGCFAAWRLLGPIKKHDNNL